MSSSRFRSGLAAVALSMLLATALGGCVEPLYNARGPGVLENDLQAIKIDPIPDRFGHYLEKELNFAFNGTGAEVTPRYRLVVKLNERVQAPVVDTVTSRATAATVIGDVEYQLYPIGGTEPLMKGVAFSVASYDRFSQRISNVQAARDAETRDAKAIAEQIRTQITARFAARD
jgi:LPS-assembly lipoprotein